MGRGSGEPSATFRAGRARADAGLGTGVDPAASREACERRRQVPTPRGEISVAWKREKNFTMTLTLPPGVTAKVELPAFPGSRGVWIGGKQVQAHRDGQWWKLENDVSGTINLEER